ncbi:hypothetical protein [Sphingobacterium sp. E70]|nr:hypothetical protein [Sphingobacterium sp. E70]
MIERLTRSMSADYSICVVTNDIYTREDAMYLQQKIRHYQQNVSLV